MDIHFKFKTSVNEFEETCKMLNDQYNFFYNLKIKDGKTKEEATKLADEYMLLLKKMCELSIK